MIYKLRFLMLYISIFLLLMSSISCKSTSFTQNVELCGLLIDEKNQPISEAKVILKKNGFTIDKVYSNERGIFLFNDVKNGTYSFLIEKHGYEKKEILDVAFIDCKKVFCFHVKSKKILFEEIDTLFEKKRYKSGLSLVDCVFSNSNSNLYYLCCLYKSFGYYKMGNFNEAFIELNKVKSFGKKLCGVDYSVLEKKLEGE